MTVEEIITTIKNGLTGKAEADREYLVDQLDKYKDHPYKEKIIHEISKMLTEIVDDEDIEESINDVLADTNDTLNKTAQLIHDGKAEEAVKMIEPLVEKIEQSPIYKEARLSEYHSFTETFQQILYYHLYEPEKDLKPTDLPYAEIYFVYGNALFELKKFSQAKEALEKANHFNPCESSILLELGEISKSNGDLDEFLDYTREAFKVAYKTGTVAHCHRNFAYYFTEISKFKEAVGSLMLSLNFEEKSEAAKNELEYIYDVTNGEVEKPTIEDIREYCEMYDFPLGADRMVLNLSYAYGQHFYQQKDYSSAEYFLNLYYDLTKDIDAEKMLRDIKRNKKVN